MVEYGPSLREQQMVRQQLVQTACLENDEKALGRGMGIGYRRMEEWCMMLDTIGLCILAMFLEQRLAQQLIV